jgi:hypothetical protein
MLEKTADDDFLYPHTLALSDRFEKALTKTFLTHTPYLFAGDFFFYIYIVCL